MKKEEPKIETQRLCHLCGIEMNHGQVHISLEHCVKDLRERVVFLRGITQGQARELDWERTAIAAAHRVAFILINHFTEDGRVTLPKSLFVEVDPGAAITMVDHPEDLNYEVIAVKPAKQETPS